MTERQLEYYQLQGKNHHLQQQHPWLHRMPTLMLFVFINFNTISPVSSQFFRENVFSLLTTIVNDASIQVTGPELIFGALYDHIGYEVQST